ncbi:MAG: Glu/Leu/Phe/Val dehydrogenase [Candidatus Aenigmarchaeota archaeon]|nr:Glu/Leu/Phe/Val dehydrogenase [Candidatus Aenigmarchaeota archaeon]
MVFENIEKRLRELDLSEDEIKELLKFDSIKYSELEVDGKKYPAWRIRHNTNLGPGKGGIRFHQNVSEDEVKSLAFWMSIKNSLAGLPFGGAKGGVKVNSKELTKEQLEKLSREYIRAFYKYLGQYTDIPAPDVNTTSEIMGWMLDEYEKLTGKKEPGMITGKPVDMGGIEFRKDSTSKGGFIMLNEFLSKVDSGKNVVIQGFGNAGSYVALMLYKNGFNIIAVSDSKGAIFNKDGLDIPKVIEEKNKTKTVTTYNANKITNKELLELDTDILILAALENQITKENVNNIKAKYIVELANGPITAEADNILYDRGIIILPDVLANSGGVVGSYFEWMQNVTGEKIEYNELEKEFEKIMKNNFNKVYNYSNENNISMRKAAYIIAIKRILEAKKEN